MNRQIKQLADQCYRYVLGEKVFDQDKFANLLIETCGKIADESADDEDNRYYPSAVINKHFGIK